MDNEKAKFILRNFRPDGADANDPDFAEALKLAMESRELGEWLASERAFDSAFSSALNSVSLPRDLREDILSCLAAERGDFPQAESLSDASWIGALATIQPPASLRNEVLMAMERTAKAAPAKKKASILRRTLIPLAAAAGIALAFFIADPMRPKAIAGAPPIPVEALQPSFADAYKSPFFRLDKKGSESTTLVQYMKQEGLPIPLALPSGLQKLSGVGCRELVIRGKRGSLFCFRADKGVIHLVIFRREDVLGELPPMEHPTFSKEGKWASARWEHGENACFVMSKTEPETLAALL
jgi:hypothetical protein